MANDIPRPAMSARASGRRWLLGLTAMILAGLGAWLAWTYRTHIPWLQPADSVVERFPAGVLDQYWPEDTAVVVDAHPGDMRMAPVIRRHQALRDALDHLVWRSEYNRPWMQLIRARVQDLHELRVIFCTSDVAKPLWLARGHFDAARFQLGPDKLQEKVVDHFRIYEYRDPDDGTLTSLALVNDTLAVSDSPERLLTALKCAAHPDRPRALAPEVRKLLEEVKPGQSLWIVASFDRLGAVPALNDKGLEMVLRPLMRQAANLHGGVTLNQDMRARFSFQAHADAENLANVLQSCCTVAQGLPLLPGIEKDMVPLFRLLGTGTVSHEGRTVRLRCQQSGAAAAAP